VHGLALLSRMMPRAWLHLHQHALINALLSTLRDEKSEFTGALISLTNFCRWISAAAFSQMPQPVRRGKYWNALCASLLCMHSA